MVNISLANKKNQQLLEENGQSHQMLYVGTALIALLLFLVACRVFGVFNVTIFLLVVISVRGIAACDGPDLEYLSTESLVTIFDCLHI